MEYAGLHPKLEALGPLGDIPGYKVVVRTQRICHAVCAEIRGLFVAIAYRLDDFQCFTFLMNLVIILGFE